RLTIGMAAFDETLNVIWSFQFGRPSLFASETMTLLKVPVNVLVVPPPFLPPPPPLLPANAAGTRVSDRTTTTPASMAPGVGFLIFIPNLLYGLDPQRHPWWMTTRFFGIGSAALF